MYMSAMMIVMTTFLMVYFLTSTTIPNLKGPFAAGAAAATAALVPPVNPNTVELLLVSAIFESWVVGLVAGKMGEGGIADGFKHSVLLVSFSVITVYVAALFIKIPL
jgi:flagellar protein FlaJ